MKLNPLYQAFIEAGYEAGYPKTDDYNGEQQEGFGAMHMTVNQGIRASASNAYINQAKNRSNLTIVQGVLVQKVLLKGKTAIGVEYKINDQIKTVNANKEVILSAGSVGSPQLLQLSGIGPADVLKSAGVELQHELPGVGENLQDHLETYITFNLELYLNIGDIDNI
jgi:choline dehydrogenase